MNFLKNYAVVWCVSYTIASSDEPHVKEADHLLWRIRTLDFEAKIQSGFLRSLEK